LATTLTRRSARLSNVSWVWRLKNIGEVPHRRVEVEAAMSFLSGWSANRKLVVVDLLVLCLKQFLRIVPPSAVMVFVENHAVPMG
jgi:hypothetical protein